MNTLDWFKRFAVALVAASSLLAMVQLLKGDGLYAAAVHGSFWGAVFAGLFTLIGYVRYRRNPACMVRRPKQ